MPGREADAAPFVLAAAILWRVALFETALWPRICVRWLEANEVPLLTGEPSLL